MIVCITSKGPSLDAPLDPTFGRAAYFLFVDSEKPDIAAHKNTPSAHGAGVQAAQFLADKGVSALITGNVGPNALRGLEAARISVFTCPSGTAEEALQRYTDGTLTEATVPTNLRHGGTQ